jgi:hypothetical protein
MARISARGDREVARFTPVCGIHQQLLIAGKSQTAGSLTSSKRNDEEKPSE